MTWKRKREGTTLGERQKQQKSINRINKKHRRKKKKGYKSRVGEREREIDSV